MIEKTNIIIVDDNPAFLKGISTFISKKAKFNVVETLNSGDELLESKNIGLADLILLDIEMPGINGIETAKKVNFKYPHIKIVAITMYREKVYLRQLVAAGVNGFMNKTEVPEKLFSTIETVMNNKFMFPDNINL